MRLGIDIINELEDRLGWTQSKTLEAPVRSDEQRKLLRLLNRVLKAWQALDEWALLRTDADLVLVASETSTIDVSDPLNEIEQYVTATANSDILTIADIALDATYIGRAIQVSGDNYIYRIIDVPTAVTLQLNRAWVGSSITVADERTFTIAADRYALPTNFDRPTGDLQAFFAPFGIQPVSPQEFARRRQRSGGIEVGEPEVYTIYGMNDAETVELLHFDPYPESARLLAYTYQRNHPEIDSDNDKILIQERYIEALIDMVLQLAFRDYEDDSKVQQALADMLRQFNTQHSNPGVTSELPMLRPDKSVRSSWQRAYG